MYAGRKLRIFLDGTLIAAAKAKSVSFGRGSIDETDGEDNGWQFLNPKPDTRSITLQVDGVTTATNFRLLDLFFETASPLPELLIEFPDGTEIDGDGGFLQSLSFNGENADAVLFSASILLSSAPVIVYPEPPTPPTLPASFVVGANDINAHILKSDDGITWNAIDTSAWLTQAQPGRIWQNADSGRLIGIIGGPTDGNGRIIVISDDYGDTWDQYADRLPDIGSNTWNNIHWGRADGLWVVIGTASVAVSEDDGETWDLYTPAALAGVDWKGIIYDDISGKWLITGQNTSANATDPRSTWTTHALALNATPHDLAQNLDTGRILAGTVSGSNVNYTDDGGDTWTGVASGFADNKVGVVRAENLFFAMGVGGGNSSFRKSAAAASWADVGTILVFPGGHAAYHPSLNRVVMATTDTTPSSLVYWAGDGDGTDIAAGSEPSTFVSGISAAPFAVNVPDPGDAPVIFSLDPSTVEEDTGAFTLTVYGGKFQSDSVVRWNGSARTTVYVSRTELQATILATDILTPGTYPITVYSPAPINEESNSVNFEVTEFTQPQPSFANVEWLMGFEDMAEGDPTPLTDESSNARTVLGNGGQEADEDSPLVGSVSLLCPSQDYISVADAAVFEADQEFVAEALIQRGDTGRLQAIFAKRQSGSESGWIFFFQADDTIRIIAWAGGSIVLDLTSSSSFASTAAQYAVAVERQSDGTWTIFVDGAVEAQGSESATPGANSSRLYFGRDQTTAGREFTGIVDELRFSSEAFYGGAAYTPSFPYPRS